MITFHVPTQTEAADSLVFCVPARAVLFAGSRHGTLAPLTASRLVDRLTGAGFGFLVGCAPGIDASFRQAVSSNEQARETSLMNDNYFSR